MQHIICFGNLWQGDDGFGIHVFRRLKEGCVLPRQVKVFEGGVAGLQALPYFEGCRKAIVVDALRSAGNLGVFIVLSQRIFVIRKRNLAFTISA